MDYMVLFFTHSGAIKFDRKCKREDISCELMPVPRSLSSNCSISGKISYEGEIKDLIDKEVEMVYSIQDGENRLVYEAD